MRRSRYAFAFSYGESGASGFVRLLRTLIAFSTNVSEAGLLITLHYHINGGSPVITAGKPYKPFAGKLQVFNYLTYEKNQDNNRRVKFFHSLGTPNFALL